MEQARYFVCRSCGAAVPSGHKYCGECGAPVPEARQSLDVTPWVDSAATAPARFVVIRGEQHPSGTQIELDKKDILIGRSGTDIVFDKDPWVSARHAAVRVEKDRVIVRDAGSVNGIYVRIKKEVEIGFGAQFICGQQVFRLDAPPNVSEVETSPSGDDASFFASPFAASSFRLVQVLEGGGDGLEYCCRKARVTIGREECDVNFPGDIFISGKHSIIEQRGAERFALMDNVSRNGTFVRIQAEESLYNDDYLFVGHQLMRVQLGA